MNRLGGLGGILIISLFVLFLGSQSAASWQCNPACKTGYKCILNKCVMDNSHCKPYINYTPGPKSNCAAPRDPQNRKPSPLEKWFTKELFYDLFPRANIGYGPHNCWPYSYESFIIAARYFPRFGTEAPNNGFSAEENSRRDVSAFFAHAIQETGENDVSVYRTFSNNIEKADACFFRGGFFNWFEGGPISSFLPPESNGKQPEDGQRCNQGGVYCSPSKWYPCHQGKNGSYNTGCYFGRGAIQISYNYNYKQFQNWLSDQKIYVDLLQQPNQILTKMDPPLGIMASLWFYMTPQPPKPSMHDIVVGNWKSNPANINGGYHGAIFGPSSLIINGECQGEQADPLAGAESRRIKAFRFFAKYFNFRLERDELLTCKNMQVKFGEERYEQAYAVDNFSNERRPCQCAPVKYSGEVFPYYKPGYYPEEFVALNSINKAKCEESLYSQPSIWNIQGSECLNHPRLGTGRGLPGNPEKIRQNPSPVDPVPVPIRQPRGPVMTGSGVMKCSGAGNFANPKDCGSFYICGGSEAEPQLLKCPAGLMFNGNACDWKQNVKCNSG